MPDHRRQTTNDRPQNPLTTHYSSLINIAIFASGTGTNAQKIIDHFRPGSYPDSLAKISLIACNKKGAGVLQIAEKEKIPVLIIEKEKFFSDNSYLGELHEKKI